MSNIGRKTCSLWERFYEGHCQRSAKPSLCSFLLNFPLQIVLLTPDHQRNFPSSSPYQRGPNDCSTTYKLDDKIPVTSAIVYSFPCQFNCFEVNGHAILPCHCDLALVYMAYKTKNYYSTNVDFKPNIFQLN